MVISENTNAKELNTVQTEAINTMYAIAFISAFSTTDASIACWLFIQILYSLIEERK